MQFRQPGAENTPDSCASLCAAAGYPFFGVQWYGECNCDNDYGAYGEADNCDTPCTADESVMCGGSWANSVYRLTGAGEISCYVFFFFN